MHYDDLSRMLCQKQEDEVMNSNMLVDAFKMMTSINRNILSAPDHKILSIAFTFSSIITHFLIPYSILGLSLKFYYVFQGMFVIIFALVSVIQVVKNELI